jgi:hypothetical protein
LITYVFDTDSFGVLGNYYPERFPTFRDNFNAAIEDGTVASVREVYIEMERNTRAPWLLEWAKQNRASFLMPSAAEMQFVADIFQVPHFRSLVSETQRLQGFAAADPFIIACAGVTVGCVVTEAALKPNAAMKPNVCQHFGVDCTNVEGFVDRMGWRF